MLVACVAHENRDPGKRGIAIGEEGECAERRKCHVKEISGVVQCQRIGLVGHFRAVLLEESSATSLGWETAASPFDQD
ncbi:hypothetical protein [Corynebacterium macginleyi]|uniref:hypothetical protein n=1 Tax=Corynebacterium macginleyi TaxID=38290 RepID=UPI00190B5451